MFLLTLLHHTLTAPVSLTFLFNSSRFQSSEQSRAMSYMRIKPIVLGAFTIQVFCRCVLCLFMLSEQAQMWCYWTTSPRTAPPIYITMATCLGKGGARSPSKTRWSIPKVCVGSPLSNRLRMGFTLKKKIPNIWGNNPLLSKEQKYVAINLYL